MLTQALYTTLNIVDMFWVGKLGPVSVAAVALSGSVMSVLFAAGQMFTVGAMATSARAAGANSRSGVQESLRHAMAMAAVISLPLAVAGALLAGQLLGLFRPATEVIAAGQPYLRLMLGSLPFFFTGMVAYSVFQGLGDTRTPMLIISATNVLNAILDPILIFGWLGVPRLGVTGAALATVLSLFVGISVMGLTLRHRGLLHLRGAFRMDAFRTLTEIGIPAGLQAVTRPITGMMMFAIVTGFGTAATAAFGIGLRALEVMYVYLAGLGSAGETLVGQSLGRRDPGTAARVAHRLSITGLLLQLAVMPVLFIMAPRVIGLFSADPEVIRAGTSYLRFLTPVLVIGGLSIAWASAQRGAGATTNPMVAAVVANWFVKLPAALLFARLTPLGLNGVWLGIAASVIVEAAVLAFGYFRGQWKHKELAWS